jgi:hypothetical protein
MVTNTITIVTTRECGGADCVEHVELLSIEYAACRGQAILAPGHTQVV